MLAFMIAGFLVAVGVFIAVISLKSPLLLLIALPLGIGCFISNQSLGIRARNRICDASTTAGSCGCRREDQDC